MSGYDVSTITRVVVGVSGSLGSVTALRRATALARRLGAELWPVLAWEPPGGDSAVRRSPAAGLPVEEWQRLAKLRLASVLEEIFDAEGPGVPMRPLVVQGAPGRALVATADRENDLLVVGAGRRGLRRAFSGRVSRHCLAHAVCPVLAVPPSPLQSELLSVHRRNTWHLRIDTRDL
ncbi:universal stress protein [Streptomyces sp. 5-8]|uniref:Universal stress protein n=1 Tax=Streptomyces musisoli TaxID=2802280 RepID=A0ABS1PC58_9ACTN|nr:MULTISPECIES: universal stress protein [Streptomyces]MBL1109928.1 universal stress protein [Streptomyces musisoli]MBY8846849.1 universal stress protein [Streptomyces sp. SP2-10]